MKKTAIRTIQNASHCFIIKVKMVLTKIQSNLEDNLSY